jgi:hypothetical protein
MADCAACGLPLLAGARYCRHCGVGVAEAGRLSDYARTDPPAPARPEVSPPGLSRPVAPPPGAARAVAPVRGSESAAPLRTGSTPTRWTGRALPAIVAALSLAVVVAFGVATARRVAGPQLVPGPPAPVGGALGSRPAATGTASSSPPPGQVAVQLASSLQDAPHATAVVALFRQYFQAVNDRDYDSWEATLSGDRPHESRGRFLEEYSTTVDDDIHVVGITQLEDGSLQIAVSFRSRQEPQYAPPDQRVGCLRWQIAYPLVFEDDRFKIAKVEFGGRMYRPCPDSPTRPG